jgi:thiamine-monophosphate kinase
MEAIYAESISGSVMKNSPGNLHELALIEKIKRASAGSPPGRVRVGIGDDCAVIRPPTGHEIVVTTDFSLEGRHFRRDWHSPESAGHRCLARGLSDLAAMGAKPLAAFLSLALPRETDRLWIDGFFRGLRALSDAVGVPLAGGDTAASPGEHILADIILLGSVPAGMALLRSGAMAGDLIYVTDSLGGAAAELEQLPANRGTAAHSVTGGDHPQLFPSPRLDVGNALLRRKLATSCIDISDGLSTDLKHLCEASHLSAELTLAALPIHPLALGRANLALHGGEDYELLFSARPTTRIPSKIAGIKINWIGRFTTREPRKLMTIVDEVGVKRSFKAGGWEHRFD